jgi:hypothetical protein
MKLVGNSFLDAAFDYLAENGTLMVICADSSTSYAAVDSTGDTRVLLTHSLTSADYTNTTGDASGRKVTISSQDSLDVSRTGTAENLYILDTGNTEILLVTAITTQELTAGNKANVPSFDDEIADPT